MCLYSVVLVRAAAVTKYLRRCSFRATEIYLPPRWKLRSQDQGNGGSCALGPALQVPSPHIAGGKISPYHAASFAKVASPYTDTPRAKFQRRDRDVQSFAHASAYLQAASDA